MQIVYCQKCGMRVSEDDVATGAAFTDAKGESFCPQCAPAGHAARPRTKTPAKPPTRGVAVPPHQTRSTASHPRVTQPHPHAEEPKPGAHGTPPRNNMPLIIGGVAGAIGLIMIAIAMSRGGKSVKPEQPKGAGTEPPKIVAPEQPKVTEPKKEVAQPKLEPAKVEPQKVEPAKQEPPPAVAIDDIRENYAKRKWSDLKAAVERGGISARSAFRQVQDFVTTYASTAAGKEAAEFIKTMKVEGPPPPPGLGVIIGYTRDYKPKTPGPGWRYMWNESGEIGKAANYKDLVWNEGHWAYTASAGQYPVSSHAGYVRLSPDGGHPGHGVDQGGVLERYAIAAYTLQAGETGKMAVDGRVHRNSNDGRVELRVYVNDTLKESLLCDGGVTAEYTAALGELKEGDTICVCMGPDRVDGNDTAGWDFTIYKVP